MKFAEDKELHMTFDQELLASFHKQFAKNQNHHQSLVINFFAGFSVLIVTFVYATLYQEQYLIRSGYVSCLDLGELYKTKGNFIVSDQMYNMIAIAISFIFAIGFGYILQASYSFRRDQQLIRKIRLRSGGDCNCIFASYGEFDANVLLWPPDMFLILLTMVVFFVLLLTIFMWFFSPISKTNATTAPVYILPLALMIIFHVVYRKKYKEIPKKVG